MRGVVVLAHALDGVVVALRRLATPSPATPAAAPRRRAATRQLGEAFRAYDRKRSRRRAQARSARLDDDKLVEPRLRRCGCAAWSRCAPATPTPAQSAFEKLAQARAARGSRAQVPWRLADCAWAARRPRRAPRRPTRKLIAADGAERRRRRRHRDVPDRRGRSRRRPRAAYRALVIAHPAHPLADAAEAQHARARRRRR